MNIKTEIKMKESHKDYMVRKLSELSDKAIVSGMIDGYLRQACDADHASYFADHLSTDVCRYFRYPDGLCDHFNIRWFDEWCKENRPHLLNKIYGLKSFW